MHVADDDVGNIFGLQLEFGYGFRRPEVIGGMPLLHELVPVEAGIEEDGAPVAANQPDHHGDVEFAGPVGALD